MMDGGDSEASIVIVMTFILQYRNWLDRKAEMAVAFCRRTVKAFTIQNQTIEEREREKEAWTSLEWEGGEGDEGRRERRGNG